VHPGRTANPIKLPDQSGKAQLRRATESCPGLLPLIQASGASQLGQLLNDSFNQFSRYAKRMFMLAESDTLKTGTGERSPIGMSKSVLGWTRIGMVSKEFSFNCLLKLKDASSFNFALLFIYVLLMNREGSFVPSNNESTYLLQLAKLWHPDLLSNDWTFSGRSSSHFVFNFLFGPLTLLFPLEVVGWMGRILSWSLILLALFQLGKHFRIPLWMITVSVLFWLFYRQSIVGGEWILGTFESKCIAYALLFFSLNGFMHERSVLPSILLGLAFSFHPLVGLWGGLAVGLSLLVLRYPINTIVKFGSYAALFALPGLIPLLMEPLNGGPQSPEALRFVALVVMPYHLDPFYFASSKLLLLLLGMLACFNWFQFRSAGKSHALRFLISFQVFLGLFFVLGFLARFTEHYQFLILMPCRLFPVLLPLFFFFHLMSALHHCGSIKAGKILVMVGFLALASFGNPVTLFVDRVGSQYKKWTRAEEDWEKAFKWVAKNTPTHSIIISPPWRGESFYLTQRGQIASWWAVRFDRVTEWRERLESMVGDLSLARAETTKTWLEQMTDNYNQLTTTDIASLIEKYGAEYLVSSAPYDYPVLFHSGIYKIYSLKKDGFAAISG
jgi:hypothetical protein